MDLKSQMLKYCLSFVEKGHLKHSSVNTTELHVCTYSPQRKPQQDVLTRWNSILVTQQNVLLARQAITVYISCDERQYKGPKLSILMRKTS